MTSSVTRTMVDEEYRSRYLAACQCPETHSCWNPGCALKIRHNVPWLCIVFQALPIMWMLCDDVGLLVGDPLDGRAIHLSIPFTTAWYCSCTCDFKFVLDHPSTCFQLTHTKMFCVIRYMTSWPIYRCKRNDGAAQTFKVMIKKDRFLCGKESPTSTYIISA